MNNPDDWRLQGQEKYLYAAHFRWQTYRSPRPDWDHAHWEFCYAKFMEAEAPDILWAGFVTENERWVCQDCFHTFQERFAWIVSPSEETR